MDVLFDSKGEQGKRFSLDHECVFCGNPCEKDFCCKAHEYLFYAEEEEACEEDVYSDEDEEFEIDERREQIKNDSI